jgi:hypothetical protein
VLAIERTDPVLPDQLDRKVAVPDAGRSKGGERRSAQVSGRADELDLDQLCC